MSGKQFGIERLTDRRKDRDKEYSPLRFHRYGTNNLFAIKRAWSQIHGKISFFFPYVYGS